MRVHGKGERRKDETASKCRRLTPRPADSPPLRFGERLTLTLGASIADLMRDPHVVSLTYVATPSETTSFDKAAPIEGTIDQFRFRLAGGELRIEPTGHFGSIEEARLHVDRILESWEIDIALRFGNPELSFTYRTSEVVDRDPPPPGTRQIVMVATAGELSLVGSATLHVSRTRYPEPPTNFRASPDVLTLWKRYQGYRQGREPLPSMAYFCLTFLQASAGGRDNAAREFKISSSVLNRIGRLTSERGDEGTARKYAAIKSGAPLTPSETRWLEEAVKAIIRRVGEFEAIDTLQPLDLADLPSLESV